MKAEVTAIRPEMEITMTNGEFIAKVWITKHKDIIVDWHNNAYRMNDTVLELIEDSKRLLKNGY